MWTDTGETTVKLNPYSLFSLPSFFLKKDNFKLLKSIILHSVLLGLRKGVVDGRGH